MLQTVEILTNGNRCLKVKIDLSSDIRLLRVYLNVIHFIPYNQTLRIVGSAKDLGDEVVLGDPAPTLVALAAGPGMVGGDLKLVAWVVFDVCYAAELSLQTVRTSLVPICSESSHWSGKSELELSSQLEVDSHSKV